jgi:AcrR family transcriptional regulator
MTVEPPEDDALIGLIRSSLAQHSGTDGDHLFGVPAATSRRRGTVHRLLVEATNIIAEEGMAALTFRKLSARCGMGGSNLQYYFPSSEDLIRAVMRFILAEYLEALLHGPFLEAHTPDERLRSFLQVQAEDVQMRRTNALFLALWDLAQRDSFVAKGLGEIYAVERLLIRSMLWEIHPTANEDDLARTAAIVAALLEGLMPLFGPASTAAEPQDVHAAAVRYGCVIAGIAPP